MGNTIGPTNKISTSDKAKLGHNKLVLDLVHLVEKKRWSGIKTYLKSNPSVLSQVFDSSNGQLACHKAFLFDVPTDVISEMLALDCAGLSVADSFGKYPIHYAVLHGSDILNVFKIILQYDSVSLSRVDIEGNLPLHFAISNYKMDEDLIRYMVETFPESKRSKNKQGKMALHCACEFRAPVATLKFLLSQHEIILQEFYRGRLPLHIACEEKCPIDHITLLLTAFPDAASIKGYEGMLPIHLAISSKLSLELANLLIEANPAGLLLRDRKNKLPLHYALEKYALSEVVIALVTACPESASYRDKTGAPGNFPLSQAIERRYPFEVIEVIMKAYREGARVTDIFNVYPLRAAIKAGATENILQMLLDEFPGGSRDTDEYERLPLHYAASKNMVNFSRSLIEAYPEGSKVVDKNRQIPLHLAVIRCTNLQIIEALLAADPSAALSADKYDYLPINYAIEEENAILGVFEALLQAREACAAHRCSGSKIKGRLLTLHHALEYKRDFPIVQTILAAYPTALETPEAEFGMIPLTLAIKRHLPLPTLQLLLDSHPPPGAAFLADQQGLLPIHYALLHHAPVEVTRAILAEHPLIVTKKDYPLHYEGRLGETLPSAVGVSARVGDMEQEQKTKEIESKTQSAPSEYRLLIHYAVEQKALFSNLAEVLLRTMPYSHKDGSFNKEHSYTWTFLLAETNDYYWKAVELVLNHYDWDINLIHKLYNFPDQKNRKVMDIVTPKCRHAIVRRLYYFAQYEMKEMPIMHKSRNSELKLAIDHNSTTQELVVLKFMRSKPRFARELSLRSTMDFSPRFVVPFVRYHDTFEDPNYKQETIRRKVDYPFLLVVRAAERDLQSIIDHEYVAAGRDYSLIQSYGAEVLQALEYVHSLGLVHGNLKPSNIMRDFDGKVKFIDLGSMVLFHKNELVEVVPDNRAYVPPELATTYMRMEHGPRAATAADPLDKLSLLSTSLLSPAKYGEEPATYNLIAPVTEETQLLPETFPFDANREIQPKKRPAGTRSMDLWAVGAIFYELCTGEKLLLTNFEDDVDDDQLDMIAEWPALVKEQRMKKISDPLARHLISQLLSKAPDLRPSASYCLKQHPFFLANVDRDGVIFKDSEIIRYPGMKPEYDFYVIYRCSKNSVGAQKESPSLQEPRDVQSDSETIESEAFGVSASSSEMSLDMDLDPEARVDGGGVEDAVESKGSVGEDSVATKTDADNDEQPALLLPGQQKEQSNTDQSPQQTEAASDCSLGQEESGASVMSGALDDIEHLKIVKDHFEQNGLKTATSSRSVPLFSPGVCTDNMASAVAQHTLEKKIAGSSAMVIILSRFAINMGQHSIQNLTAESFDQMLYEIRLAMELKSLGLLEKGIFVIAVGDRGPAAHASASAAGANGNNGVQAGTHEKDSRDGDEEEDPYVLLEADKEKFLYDSYFQDYLGEMTQAFGGSHPHDLPQCIVRVIERRVEEFLYNHGYGGLKHRDVSVKDIFKYILDLPIFHIVGETEEAFGAAAASLIALYKGEMEFERPETLAVAGRPLTAAFNQMIYNEIRSPALYSRKTLHPRPASTSFGNRAGLGLAHSASIDSFGWSDGPLPGSDPAPRGMRASTGTGDRTHSDGPLVPNAVFPSPSRGSTAGSTHPRNIAGGGGGGGGSSSAHRFAKGRKAPGSADSQTRTREMPSFYPRTPLTGAVSATPTLWAQPEEEGDKGVDGEFGALFDGGGEGVLHSIDTFNLRAGDRDKGNYYSLPSADHAPTIVQLPYFTEIVGEDKAKTASAMTYLAEKLDSKESEVLNLHNEMALLREALRSTRDELTTTRSMLKIRQEVYNGYEAERVQYE